MELKPYSLVLGAGGARGIAHIGVIKILEKMCSLPSLIIGTSMGAVIGAMYAQTTDIETVEDKLEKFINSDFFQRIGLDLFILGERTDRHQLVTNWINKVKRNIFLTRTLTRMSALPDQILLEAYSYLIEDQDISDTKIPFCTVATDIVTGEAVILQSGSILKAVTASSSIPAICSPVKINDRLLIDGGASCITPTTAAKVISHNPVVAVDVWKTLSHQSTPTRGLTMLLRAGEVTQYNLNKLLVKQAEIVVKPNVQTHHWANFGHFPELVKSGMSAMEDKKDELYKIIGTTKSKRKTFLNRIFKRPV